MANFDVSYRYMATLSPAISPIIIEVTPFCTIFSIIMLLMEKHLGHIEA